MFSAKTKTMILKLYRALRKFHPFAASFGIKLMSLNAASLCVTVGKIH